MASIGHELLDVPFPEMVVQLASAIAEGQYKMDMVSCSIAKMMGDAKKSPVELPDVTNDNKTIKTSLIGAGFQPTFYQFTDTIIEVKIDITINKSYESEVDVSHKGGFFISTTSVNAKYTQKYSYTAEGSSLLRTKITPVPPSTFMQKLLEMKMQRIQQEFELEVKKAELQMKIEEAKINKQIKKEEETAEQQVQEVTQSAS